MGDANALIGGAATTNVSSDASFPNRVIDTISPAYADGTPIPQVIYDAQTMVGTLQSGISSAITTLVNEAQRTVYAMVNIDTEGVQSTAQLSQLIQGQSPQSALSVLIQEMVIASYHVQAATVSAGAQTSVGSPNGNPVILLSLKNPQGVALQLIYPETLTFICTRDAQSGNATLGNESLSAFGQVAVSPFTSPLWPAGSGAQVSLTAVTAGTSNTQNNNSAGNLLVNSGFIQYTTSNIPDNWSILVGVAGTNIFNGSGTSYLTGGSSVEFVGNSSTLTSIAQSYGTTPTTTVGAGGTGYALAPDTVIQGVLFYKLSSVSPAAGVLALDLVNSSNTVIQNDAGSNNAVSVALTGVADTSWHALPYAFQTPAILPSGSPVGKLRIHLTTALTTGTNLYLSNLTQTLPTPLYQGGPYASVHSGNSQLIAGSNPDTYTIAMSNNYQTSGTGLMQSYFQRVFNMLSLGLQLPITGSNVIDDSLIA